MTRTRKSFLKESMKYIVFAERLLERKIMTMEIII